MKQIATHELSGAALDWAVAKCGGSLAANTNNVFDFKAFNFSPSTNWAQGGPIIERERMGVWPSESIEGEWACRPDYEVYPKRTSPSYGTTPLIAAMRCYVASKLGDTIDVPTELT